MAPRVPMAFAFIALGICPAFAGSAPPPDLDCKIGFEGLRTWAAWLPNAEQKREAGGDVVVVREPEVWRVEISFTEPGQPAHPAVTLRKFVKQVTGVWTAQSKSCGYGNQTEFMALVEAKKAEDSRLTNLSRAEVERQKQEVSPLGSR